MGNFIITDGVLLSYKGTESHVVILDNVTKIGDYAFLKRRNIISVKIPNGVTHIGQYAFNECSSLESIEIPNSVTEIGYGAFEGCKSLASVKFSKGVTSIGVFAFSDCPNLTHVEIPNSVTEISDLVFFGSTNLSHIEIPNSVEYIGEDAFRYIKNVKPQYKSNGVLRAFKAFRGDWTCRRFQYAVGKSYHQDGKIECCENGFHACPNPLSVFNYYYGDLRYLRFAEVELSNEMSASIDKVAASDIKIVRELTASELVEIYNSMEKE